MTRIKFNYRFEETEIDYGNNILNISVKLFKKYGIISVNLQDIARETGVSITKLKKEYPNKKAIINAISDKFFQVQNSWYENLKMDQEVETEYKKIIFHSSELFRLFNPKIVFEIKKKCPEIIDQFISHKERIIIPHIAKNLEKGIKAGVYKQGMSVEINSRLFLEQLQLAYDSILFPSPQFDDREVIVTIIDNQLFGIKA